MAMESDITTCELTVHFTLVLTNTGAVGGFHDIVVAIGPVLGAEYVASIDPLLWNVPVLAAGESISTPVVVTLSSTWDTVAPGTQVQVHAVVVGESCDPVTNIGRNASVTATRDIIPPDGYESDNSLAQANAILVDGTLQAHNFDVDSDVDWIMFEMVAGNEYVIETFDTSRLADTIIELYSADQTLLATGVERTDGRGNVITWTAAVSGTYYVKIYPTYPENCGCENEYKVRVTERVPQPGCDCPEWITFHTNRDGNWELYRVDSSGGQPIRLTNDAGIDRAPSRSPDAALVAFESNRSGRWDIFTVTSDGQTTVQLTHDAGQNARPVWAPPCGSGEIAFQSYRDGNWEIYIMNGDGTGQTRVTTVPAADVHPFWSPDAAYLTFQSSRSGNWDVFRIGVDGANEIQLTDSPADDVDPVWSPDGSLIAFRSNREGKWHIYVMPATGGPAQRVSGGDGNDLLAVWSPDGQWLAYQSDRDGQTEVYVVRVATLEERRITDNAASDEAPTWSCDSETVAFQSFRDGNWELYTARIADGQILVRLTEDSRIDAYPMWNPLAELGSRLGLGRLFDNHGLFPVTAPK